MARPDYWNPLPSVFSVLFCWPPFTGKTEIGPSARSTAPLWRTGRVLFCFSGESEIVLLHAFIKKTQKTPQADLELARRRMKGS